MHLKKFTKQVPKLLLLISLSAISAPEAYSHTYEGDDFDAECDDAHSIWDKNAKSDFEYPNYQCFDIRKGKYKKITSQGGGKSGLWEICPRGYYCPGGSDGKIRPDMYTFAPDEKMSKPNACPTNQLSNQRTRQSCSYPKNLSEWDQYLDTKPKKSKYNKNGRLVCKDGANYSKQKGKCR